MIRTRTIREAPISRRETPTPALPKQLSGRCSVQVWFPVLALGKNISWQLKL